MIKVTIIALVFVHWAGYALSQSLPLVFSWDPKLLATTKAKVLAGDQTLAPSAKVLVATAEECLKTGPFSVTFKNYTPPSGSKHDYMSIGTYYWPCNYDGTPHGTTCNMTSGLPWVRRDGIENPMRYQFDSFNLAWMSQNVTTLSLAYYFTGEEKYASRAAYLIDGWFLNASTRMNPNMLYSQIQPGINDGFYGGIIDSRFFIDGGGVVNSAGLLSGSPSWTPAQNLALQKWFGEFANWLLTSDFGKEEVNEVNNHGTWYDVQTVAYSIYSGDLATAKSICEKAPIRRIAEQVASNGSLPYELVRTKAFWYEFFAIQAFFELSTMCKSEGVEVDLFNYTTRDGRGIKLAVKYIVPYAIDEKPWPFQQIIPFDHTYFYPIFREASIVWWDDTYEKYISKLPPGLFNPANDPTNLVFPKYAEPQ